MSSSQKSHKKGGDRTSPHRPSATNAKKSSAPASSSTSAHTTDSDYMSTLQSQIEKEKKKKSISSTNSNNSSIKKKQRTVTASENADDDAADDELSAENIKKAMAAAMKDSDENDKSSTSGSRSSSHKSSSSHLPQHANAKVVREANESEEEYKQRLKRELRKRKQEKKKKERSTVVQTAAEKAHAEAVARREAKRIAHLERTAAERQAKLEKQAKEREELAALQAENDAPLTNKQKRLLKQQQEKENGGTNASSSKKKSPQLKPSAPVTSKPTASSSKLAPSSSSHTPSSALSPPLPAHHDWEQFNLHPSILRALLLDLKFMKPQPIQQEVLIPAIRDWKDISAAATTGSGKTLAFGIPIVQRLLTLQETDGWVDPKKIQALILTPTRELALQIVTHLEAITKYTTPTIGVVGIVGGVSEEKQKRILDKKHPAIVVATPGRLWELIEEAQLTHLSSAYYLRFLVLDEADRMIDFGHFPELEKILEWIRQNSTEESVRTKSVYKKAVDIFDGFEMIEDEEEKKDADDEEEGENGDANEQAAEDEEDEDVSAQAIAAAAALNGNSRKKNTSKQISSKSKKDDAIDWDSFLTEEQIFAKQGRKMPKETADIEQANEESEDEEEEEQPNEEDEDQEMAEEQDEEQEDEEEESKENDVEDGDDGDEEAADDAADAPPPHTNSKTLRRQVFLFSATLMLSTSGREDASKQRSGRKNKREPTTVLEKLLDKIEFQSGRTPFQVDLTTTHQVASTLEEVRAECVTEDKDYLAYYFLLLYTGKTLVFVNSISCLRRLVNLLQLLKMNAHGLHADMQQKARLKSLERFKSEENAILICTDVAARGLDIPAVPYVIHYQLPRTSEIYIHRSGRVARAGEAGVSCALIDETDSKNYRRICTVLKKVNGIPALPIDAGFMTQIRTRMNVARQLDTIVNADRKANTKRDWFLRQAEAMEMEVDEDEMQLEKHDERFEQENDKKLINKGNLQRELDFLLSKPLLHGTLNRKYYTLNAARGFDLNQESAGIAKAGAKALENVAIGNTQNAAKKLPNLLKQARTSTATASTPKQTKKKQEVAEESKEHEDAEMEDTTPPSATTSSSIITAPAAKIVTSLSVKRKQPEPPAPRTKGNKRTAPPAAVIESDEQPATPASESKPTKKQKLSTKK